MNSCIKRLHQEMSYHEVIIIRLTDDYELTLRKTEKVTNSGRLIVIIRNNGRRVVINPKQVLFFYTKEVQL